MLPVRLYGDLDVEEAFIRKDFHEAGRLCDCLCNSYLSMSGEKSADESGFGEHGEECLLLLCSGGWITRGRIEFEVSVYCAKDCDRCNEVSAKERLKVKCETGEG